MGKKTLSNFKLKGNVLGLLSICIMVVDQEYFIKFFSEYSEVHRSV